MSRNSSRTNIIGTYAPFQIEPVDPIRERLEIDQISRFNSQSFVLAHPIASFTIGKHEKVKDFLTYYSDYIWNKKIEWQFCKATLGQSSLYDIGLLLLPRTLPYNWFVIQCHSELPVEIGVDVEGMFLGDRRRIGWQAPSLAIMPSPRMDIVIPVLKEFTRTNVSLRTMPTSNGYFYSADVEFSKNER